MPRYEYKFVRLDQAKRWLTSTTTPSASALLSYQQVVEQYAADGWRLVQIFAPGIGHFGEAAFFELIFERVAGAGLAPPESAPSGAAEPDAAPDRRGTTAL
jgi:hypothetical protein